jgi:nitrogen regulatory protein PII
MGTVPLRLVTLVAESVLAEMLTEDLKRLGARGFTKTEAQGEGSRHLRAGEIPGHNVKIETVVTPAVADAILEHVAQTYFSDYAIIAYVSEVHVVRGEKYA